MRLLPQSRRDLPQIAAIGFAVVIATVAALWYYHDREKDLLPTKGDPRVLVEAIILKQGEENLLRRLGCTIDYQHHSVAADRLYQKYTEDFQFPSSLRFKGSTWQNGLYPSGGDHLFEHLYVSGVEWPINNGRVNEAKAAPGAWLSFLFLGKHINPLLLRQKELSLTMLGARDIGDHETTGLRVEFPGEMNCSYRDYYFDRKSGQLVMMCTSSYIQPGRWTQEEYHFDRFESYDGTLLPAHCLKKVNGKDGSTFTIRKVSFPSSFSNKPPAQ